MKTGEADTHWNLLTRPQNVSGECARRCGYGNFM